MRVAVRRPRMTLRIVRGFVCRENGGDKSENERIHANRVIGSDRHHRYSCGNPTPGVVARTRSGASGFLPEQPERVGSGIQDVRQRVGGRTLAHHTLLRRP